jgi:hypothetical protein
MTVTTRKRGDVLDVSTHDRKDLGVRGGQRIRLQLGQCDVLGLVGVRPAQLGGYSPCVVLQRPVAEEPDPQPTDFVENTSRNQLPQTLPT